MIAVRKIQKNDTASLDCPACHKPILHDQVGKCCPWCDVLIAYGKIANKVKWWVNKKHDRKW